jgi:proline iminopeptidase
MSKRTEVRETRGLKEVLGFTLFYKIFLPAQSRPKGTVVCLHGGPGACHDYLMPHIDLAKFGYKVVFYDQLGCGKSEVPKNVALFSVERGVEELEEFRKKMRLGKIHLMGSSYGGMLALSYALRYQRNLKSLITAGGLASVPLCVDEMNRLKRALPKGVQGTMQKYEDAGDYHNLAYEKAVMVFYKRHLLRLEKWPREQDYTMRHLSKPVYYTMNGPNEFMIIGNTKYYDITDKLHMIQVPTLVMGGRYDEVTPKVARSIHNNIQGSKLVTFQKSSHMPFWEEREKYMKTLSQFLDKNNN